VLALHLDNTTPRNRYQKQQGKHLHKTLRRDISFSRFSIPSLVKSSSAFRKYYFWKFELIIDSMSSVCPELLAHLRGFGFGFLAIEVTPFSSFLLPTRVLVWRFRILVVGHGMSGALAWE